MANPSEPQVSKKSPAAKILVGILVAVCVVTLFAPLLFVLRMKIAGSEHATFGHVTKEQQRKAEEAMRLTFPASTEFLLFHRELEAAIYLKIRLPKADLSALLGQPGMKSAHWSTTSGMGALDIDPTWLPSSVRNYRAATINLPKEQLLDVEIDDDKADPKTVYLAWMAP